MSEPSLTVAAVARRLGVAPATLRTWDRRYGVGPSEHTAGAHRRYSSRDVARLRVMRRLTLQGVTPAEAARVALAADLSGSTEPAGPLTPLAAEPARPDGAGAAAGNGGGGRVIALPRATPAVRGLARAAMSLDAAACAATVAEALDARGVIATWDELVVPVLVAVGERWERTGEGVEVEHLLSECVAAALRGVGSQVPVEPDRRPVVLACAEAELHALPVHVLAAALAERHVASRVLGPSVPGAALAAAVRRLGPAAVFVWSQLAATGAPEQLRGLPALRPAPVVLAGGPGWPAAGLPEGVRRVLDLPEAVTAAVAAVGG